MKPFWKASSGDVGSGGAHADRWLCQLMHAEFVGESAVFDFVALEPGPAWGKHCSRFAPFTVEVALPDSDQASVLREWTEEADVVTITAGGHGRSKWLCLSACDQHVMVSFVDRPDQMTGG